MSPLKECLSAERVDILGKKIDEIFRRQRTEPYILVQDRRNIRSFREPDRGIRGRYERW